MGEVHCFDISPVAIASSKQLLAYNLNHEFQHLIYFHNSSHSEIDPSLLRRAKLVVPSPPPPSRSLSARDHTHPPVLLLALFVLSLRFCFNIFATATSSSITISLQVYNLGYLPNPGKGRENPIGKMDGITKAESTLKSVELAVSNLSQRAAISIISYPHEEGLKERSGISELTSKLPKTRFLVTHMEWPNLRHAPALTFIMRDDQLPNTHQTYGANLRKEG